MKKWISMLLALVLCMSLCACGGENATEETADLGKAAITTKDGEIAMMSAQELIDVYNGNEASFAALYGGAQIHFTGTVQSVKLDTSVVVESGSVKASQNKVIFEEGWSLVLSVDNKNIDLASLVPGQAYEVTTGIVGAPFDTDFLKEVAGGTQVVWLVGDDMFFDGQFGTVTTVITPAK